MMLLTRWFGVTESDSEGADRREIGHRRDRREISFEPEKMPRPHNTDRSAAEPMRAASVSVPNRNILTFTSIAALKWERGLQREFLRSQAYILLSCVSQIGPEHKF